MPVRRAIPLAAALAACSLREPRVSNSSCSSSGQCSSANVCFLGECRPPAANLSVVRVEVRPPQGSQFAVRKGQVDLRISTVNDFSLTVPYSGSGTVTQDGSGIDGGTVVFTDSMPVIPDRVEQVVATVDTAGVYRPRLPQGVWDVLVLPAGQPPLRAGPLDTTLYPSFDVALPAAASLTSYDGGLTVNGDGGPVAGASVTAIDSQGAPLSATAVSDPNGGYSLLLPPGAPQFSLQIGPTTDPDGGTVQPAALDPFPTYPPLPYAPVIDLPLPPPATLTVRVVDAAGVLVPSARVYVRSVGTEWTLARSVVADTGQSDVSLREGDYVVQAAPPTDATSPALSAPTPVTLPLGAPFELTCPAKVRRLGQILGPDGRPSANLQILATRIADGLIPTRTASTTPTDANGVFRFVGDAGSWRLEIVPPADVRLPRTVVGVTVYDTDPQDSSMDPIRLSQPLPAGGIVTGRVSPGGADMLVANAMVSFFSLDSNSHSVLLGSVKTDLAGHYDVVLPDVADPGVGP
jgi:hypothetical protein